MTRPKVPPEQRQRTAQACESCKRRKQKCNGLCPCNTCDKRKFTCIYNERDASSPPDGGRPLKKRAFGDVELDRNDFSASNTPPDRTSNPPFLSPPAAVPGIQEPRSNPFSLEQEELPFQAQDARPTVEEPVQALPQFTTGVPPEEQPSLMSRGTTVQSGQEEEAVVYTQTRMLQDPTGRLLYVGDSATLSFLQLLRMMVENVAGSSPFTNDPRRHKIVEGQFSLPSGVRHTHLLPDQRTAHVLVGAFFVHTHGLLQVFDHQRFMEELTQCYSDPLGTDPSFLCLLNLVFAIGLTFATPLSGSEEAVIVDRLRSEHLDRAEVFYLNAKSLNDPMNGLEDQDFWSIQALLLMSLYMLAKSKRNNAFALLGMAARSAHALGLHREETMVIFSQEEQEARRNLWRSLFIMDRFLSCSLGRPIAISEDDCSGDSLHPPEQPGDDTYLPATKQTLKESGKCAIEATVRSCSVIGVILKKVYQRRKVNTRLAQEIADVCKNWPRALPAMLHWRQAATASPAQGVAILHVNLFYCHSIILLTRPFFLYVLNLETQRQASQATNGSRGPRPYLRMEKFSEACVIASTHTILLVQNAFDAGYLSRRNPAVIYFLFAAALVILSNEFAGLYRVDSADTCILNAVTIMDYCSGNDQQAIRLVYIMNCFREVVTSERRRRSRSQAEPTSLPSISTQLYGVQLPNHQQNSTAFAQNQANCQPRLHQVPIHIYPGMQQSPLHNNSSPSTPTHPLGQTLAQQHQPSLSVHLSPIQNSTGTIMPDPGFSSMSKPPSLSNVLDLSALDGTRMPSLFDESGASDENIEFDALWAWPSNTPRLGSPRMMGEGGGALIGDRVQGVSDSAVPLYGVMRADGMMDG